MRDFSNTQIQILGTLREYEFAVAKGAYQLANRIREANRDLRDDFDRIDFEVFSKHDKREKVVKYTDEELRDIAGREIDNAEQYGGPDR